MRTALVVEGSHQPHRRTNEDLLRKLWAHVVPEALGCFQPGLVFGINKGCVAAMQLRDVNLKRTTSSAEQLDYVLERLRRVHDIDCFVVAWDLLPPWDKTVAACRWQETLAFYEGLSLSEALHEPFRESSRLRFSELSQRSEPSQRPGVPSLEPGAVIAVCMDPVFEACLLDERAMRKSLEILNKRVPFWPGQWASSASVADKLVGKAIHAAREVSRSAKRTQPALKKLFNRLPGPYEISKTEWGIYLLESGNFDETLKSSGFGKRLVELKPQRPMAVRKRKR